ncbi:rab11 family-interacting protein 4-like isoform X1 [Crassostrea virginica]
MEEDVLERLRTVFNVCDERNEGYISTEHFKELAKEHFGQAGDDEKIVGIIQILDPEGKGKINFDDFCEGVQQINELQIPLSPIIPVKKEDEVSPVNASNPFHIPSTPTSNVNLLLNGFDDFTTGDISSTECPETSEASAYTYNEYDTNTDEDGHGQGVLIDLSTPEPVRRNLHLPIPNGRLDFTDEENFEDFGENDEIESDMSDPSQNRSRDSFHKVKSRRGDKHHRKSPGQRSKVTSAAYNASHLQNRSRTEPGDEILDDIDGNFQTLNDRVQFLEKKLVQISEEKSSVDTSQSKLKDENHHLMERIVDRIHSLEEQLKDVEVKSKETLAEEQKKFKQMLSRAESEKTEQMYISQRLQSIEKEYEQLKLENPKLRLEIDKLRDEKLDLQDKLADTQADYNTLHSEHEELKQKFEKERQCTGTRYFNPAQLLDELGKELEELRKYKIDQELNQSPRPRNNSMADLPGRYQALNSEVNRLKEALSYEWRNLSQENKQLQDMNEDLNAQLLTRCINEGKTLVNDTKEKSLATELEHLTKEELMARLQEVESVNINLKSYVDKIILTILEKNPSILEITNR